VKANVARYTTWLRTSTAVVVATAAVMTGATTTLAYGTTVPCGGRVEAKVFSPWKDTYNYFRMPNGGFEGGSASWLLGGGASVVPGNESFKVGGKTDAYSLMMPYGSRAESSTICVSKGEDTIRLFVNNGRVAGSILHVEAIVRNPSTGATAQTAFDVNGDAVPRGWSPTMRLKIPDLLGTEGTQDLTLIFTTRGTSATWYIDDVYVDPFKSY
jgi:hypothetical protein